MDILKVSNECLIFLEILEIRVFLLLFCLFKMLSSCVLVFIDLKIKKRSNRKF